MWLYILTKITVNKQVHFNKKSHFVLKSGKATKVFMDLFYFCLTHLFVVFLLAGSNSGMVLVLDPLVQDDGSLLIQPVLSHCQRSEGSATSLPTRCSSDAALTSEKIPAGSAFRDRLDSGASDRSHSPFRRRRLDSGASEPSVGSDVSDSGARKRSDSTTSDHSLCSEERRPAQEVHEVQAVQATQVYVGGDTSGTDSEAEGHINDQDQPDGGVLSRRGHHVNGLLNGSAKGKIDVLKEKVRPSVCLSVCPSLQRLFNVGRGVEQTRSYTCIARQRQ